MNIQKAEKSFIKLSKDDSLIQLSNKDAFRKCSEAWSPYILCLMGAHLIIKANILLYVFVEFCFEVYSLRYAASLLNVAKLVSDVAFILYKGMLCKY